MVRKFTRPKGAVPAEAEVPATSNLVKKERRSSSVPVPAKKRSPQPGPSKRPVDNNESRTSKRMRLPNRPYQAPEPIPLKILQQIKSLEENDKLSRQTPAAKEISKSPLKRTAPENPVPPKKRKPDLAVVEESKGKETEKSKPKSKPNKGKPPRASTAIPTTTPKKKTVSKAVKVLAKKPRVSIKSVVKLSKGRASTDQKPALNGTQTPKKPVKKRVKKNQPPKVEPKVSPGPSPSPPDKKLGSPQKNKKERPQLLTPRENVTKYDKDPTFDSSIPVPFISTIAQSKLLIRATRTGNQKLLEKLIKEKKEIFSFCVPRSVNVGRDAAYYALEQENTEALKLLMDPKLAENLGPFPGSIVEEESTGKGNYVAFGHGVRAVTVGRGGKEGNNALTRDTSGQQHAGGLNLYAFFQNCLYLGTPMTTISKIIAINDDEYQWNHLLQNIITAVLRGHNQLAGELVAKAIERGGYGFNELHKEALLLNNNAQFSPFKAVSVVKKSTGNSRMTPIHLAAINPDPQYLAALLNAKPDFGILDTSQRTPMHYAAACSGPGPLTLLLSRGISASVLDKEGKSPLYVAADVGRAANVDKILKGHKETDEETGNSPAHISGPFIDRPCRSTGQSPIHVAAQNGHVEVIRVLLAHGVNCEKMTPAQQDKMTPLMMAARFGQLDVVKLLIEKGRVKVDEKDKRGRTALTHAVIDGNAHIVSYLLRLGADNTVKDTSGNSLVHYAAAYGWYFNWKLLLESGCPPNDQNDWKMTPIAIAFMKGHIGLVELALSQPQANNADGTPGTVGIDINAPVNYSNGMTLLHQTCSGKPGEFLVPRIKFLVEKQGADVGVSDYEQNNALHYLVQSEGRAAVARKPSKRWMSEEREAELAKENKKIQQCLYEAAKLLLQHDCDPLKQNLKNESPVTLASKLGCFELLKLLLSSGKCETLTTPVKSEASQEISETVLHSLVREIKADGAEGFYKFCTTKPKLIAELKVMAQVANADGFTPLLLFLQRLDLNSKNKNKDDDDGDDDDETENNDEETKSVKIKTVNFLKFLVNGLESNVNQHVADKLSNSALHIIAQLKQSSCDFADKLVEVILSKKPTPDALNKESKTPLMLATSSLNESVARALLNAGANPNFKTSGENLKSILITAAENATTSFNLIPLLVEKGANVRDLDPNTGNSALHLVSKQPGKPGALEAIRKIVATGRIDATGVNKLGRTALHLAVNARGGETDVSYDVEELLIELAPKALAIADIRKRLPLHYALVKIGKHRDSSAIDPIELVAIITGGMKDAKFGDKILAADEFLGTPLHYAAQRGATISATFLMSEARGEKSRINPVDLNGNTPFGLAVLKGHEGCALYFQQNGADFMMSLSSRFKSDLDEKIWKWRHSILLEEYEERKLQEQARYPILQEVVRKDWQGLLHLMLEKLKHSGPGVTPAIDVAIKTNRLKLALKLINHVKNNAGLTKEMQFLLHTMAKSTESLDEELSKQVVASLVSKGVGIMVKDAQSATPVIYAAQNLNTSLCREFSNYAKALEIENLPADKLGRTPFSSIFWNINSTSTLPQAMKQWAEGLLVRGAEANFLCNYPITLSTFPATRSLITLDSTYSPKFSPLILAVVQGNYEIVKWLLGLNKNGKTYVDPNFPDQLGRTPLMHAVRLNDIKMVKLLLNPRTYDPQKDKKPWNSNRKVSKVPPADPSINLKLHDRNGWTAIHHLVAPLHPSNIFYFNSDVILRLLNSVGAPLEAKSQSKQTPLNLARHLKVYKLATVLQTLLGIHDYSTTSNDEQENSLTVDPAPTHSVSKVDFVADSTRMIEKLTAEQEKQLNEDGLKELYCYPDPLSGLTNSEVVLDKTQNRPFDCLLTQVDLSYGVYGLYNFYKMQVIKEKHGKELIILFTRWGRVGDTGQFQKTPFATVDEATKEFCKIFRAKSGNSWENINVFANVPKRYRLVKTDLRMKKAKKDLIKVDFVEMEMMGVCTGSKISSSVFELIKNISLIHRPRLNIENGDDDDEDDEENQDGRGLSFGAMSTEVLKKGDQVLDEIAKLLISKEVERKKSQGSEGGNQYSEQMNAIIEKSEEFYGLIPVYGFEFEKLSPMFSWDLLRPKQEKIHSLVHLDFAKQVLLAAQLGLKEENPFDYVYKALGTKIELIDQASEEAQVILQYIENTSEPSGRHLSSPSVHGIYKVQRRGEAEQIKNVGNKWLLWHGTKTQNLLSILHHGLQVVPLGAELCGHMFGKGIYFADTFSKSSNYCSQGSKDHPHRFMFLCEVALGNVQNVDFDDITDEQSALKNSFDSLKTCNASMIPDPGSVICWKGGLVPLGKRIENIPEKEDDYFCLENNEYIIFDTKQVRLRYLIQFQ